jgi:hypothetical protein
MYDERRNFIREAVREPGEIVFYLQGELYFGTILNLSPTGLCISIHEAGHVAGRIPAAGQKFDFCLTGQTGTSKCRGEIHWAVTDGAAVRAGLSLLNVPDEDDDPWRMMLNRHYQVKLSETGTAADRVSVARKIFSASRTYA